MCSAFRVFGPTCVTKPAEKCRALDPHHRLSSCCREFLHTTLARCKWESDWIIRVESGMVDKRKRRVLLFVTMQISLRNVQTLVVLSLAGGFSLNAAAAEFPTALISNGQISAKVYLPDAKKGFYRSTRFDWSGAIGSLKYEGHEFYGDWFQKVDPAVYDFNYDDTGVVSAPFTAMVGPAEEFNTAGKALDSTTPKPEELSLKSVSVFCESLTTRNLTTPKPMRSSMGANGR